METRSSGGANTLSALASDLARVVERTSRAVVAVNARQRIPSSGVLWRKNIVVTADHTVKRDEDITVMLPDGRTEPVQLAGRDPGTDLAVLRLPNIDLDAAETGDASALKVGHIVLAIGRAGELSATLGSVGVLGGSWRTWRGGQIDRLIRLHLSIYDGFSGGPLVDALGRVVGINTSGLWRGAPVAIPSSTVDRVSTELVEKGRIARGRLGVGLQPVPLPEPLTKALNLTGKAGMVVLTTEPDGAAARAGVIIGDVVVALAGEPLSRLSDVQARLGPESVGKPLKATLIRGGKLMELTIAVGE